MSEEVCQVAQETMNIITDYTRNKFFGNDENEINSRIAINQIAATNIEIYLNRKKEVLLSCIYIKLKEEGIITYLDLVMAAETEMRICKSDIIERIVRVFPGYFRDAANSFDENINTRQDNITHILSAEGAWIDLNDVSTKDLQWLLKHALGRIQDLKINVKVTTLNNETVNITQFRKHCKNAQLRNVHFRMIHNDFYTFKKMFKFKMVTSSQCPRCNKTETTRHLLWECRESQKIWKLYNEILQRTQLLNMNIFKYEDVYRTESEAVLSIVKTKIINEFIQIVRPVNWTIDNIENLIRNIKNIEIYNSIKRNDKNKIVNQWKIFEIY
jgi:hypothetical protein